MTQMISTTRPFASSAAPRASIKPRGSFILRLASAYTQLRHIKRLSAAQLADVGMTSADQRSVKLSDVFAKMRG